MALGAVLFDLDGTLVDSERENVESVVLAVRRLGAEMTADERAFVVGHSWNEIHALLARRHGLAVGMAALIASAVEEKRALVARTGYRTLPGAVESVRRLGARAPLAVVSGASCVEVRDAVEGIGLADAFRFVLGAEDYARGKPDPEPYLMAAERLGVAPGACLVVEDAAPGIDAARAAGMKVVGVEAGNFSRYDLSRANAVLPALTALTDALVDRLLG